MSSEEKSTEENVALHDATRLGLESIVKVLVKIPGADIEALNDENQTPYVVAAAKGHLDILKLFVANGLNIPEADKNAHAEEMTALHWSALRGELEVSRYLISMGANVNAIDDEKQTPLHLAAEDGKLEVSKYLLSMGAKVNALDEAGDTPLNKAFKKRHMNVMVLLMANHADCDINDKKEDILSELYKRLEKRTHLGKRIRAPDVATSSIARKRPRFSRGSSLLSASQSPATTRAVPVLHAYSGSIASSAAVSRGRSSSHHNSDYDTANDVLGSRTSSTAHKRHRFSRGSS